MDDEELRSLLTSLQSDILALRRQMEDLQRGATGQTEVTAENVERLTDADIVRLVRTKRTRLLMDPGDEEVDQTNISALVSRLDPGDAEADQTN